MSNCRCLRRLAPLGTAVVLYLGMSLFKQFLHQEIILVDNYSRVDTSYSDTTTDYGQTDSRQSINGILRHKNDSINTIKPFMFPTDAQLERMSASDLMLLFGRYTNSTQIQCSNRLMFRKPGDTGKTICDDESIRPRKQCLVYSFGSDNDFSFEESVINKFGCKVFTFDPSMKDLQQSMILAPDGCTFIPIGLGAVNHVNKDGWTIKSFEEISRQLNHSHEIIDILKVDIEGSEWETFDQMLKTGSFRRVKQLQVEIHFYDNEFHTACSGNKQQAIDCYFKALNKHQVIVRKRRLRLLQRMYEYGLRVFSSEGNVFYKNSREYLENDVSVTPLTEVSLINVNFLSNGIRNA